MHENHFTTANIKQGGTLITNSLSVFMKQRIISLIALELTVTELSKSSIIYIDIDNNKMSQR